MAFFTVHQKYEAPRDAAPVTPLPPVQNVVGPPGRVNASPVGCALTVKTVVG